MAQIFVSHSQRDEDIINLFLKAFAGTKVKPVFQELEDRPPDGITAGEITNNIQQSNAVFVLLSENVEKLAHTRDWVTWECGTAVNKEVWVFEPYDKFGKIRIVVPRLNHYVRFKLDEQWRENLRFIIETYDDSHVLPTLAITAAGGAALNEKDPGTGAIIGLGIGLAKLFFEDRPRLTDEIPTIRCRNCTSIYRVYLPPEQDGSCYLRCPVCNADSIMRFPS